MYSSWTTIDEIKETSYNVTNLKNNEEYVFHVIAFNEVGPSEPSDNSKYIKTSSPTTDEAPVIQEPLKDQVVGLKQQLTLSCIIGGVPAPEIKWYRNNQHFRNKFISYENRVAKYVITETHENCSGTYMVKATNKAGSAETSCEITIQELPKIIVDEKLITQKLRVSSQWKVSAEITGFPKPEITWKKDNQILETSKHCSIFDDDTSSCIAIYSLDRQDTGKYTITATNSAGSVSVDIELTVIGKFIIIGNLI